MANRDGLFFGADCCFDLLPPRQPPFHDLLVNKLTFYTIPSYKMLALIPIESYIFV